MKIPRESLTVQIRRRLLIALITSPLLPYLQPSRYQYGDSKTGLKDPDIFIIINGWVMLKRDLTE